jgi:hypothetical protein
MVRAHHGIRVFQVPSAFEVGNLFRRWRSARLQKAKNRNPIKLILSIPKKQNIKIKL